MCKKFKEHNVYNILFYFFLLNFKILAKKNKHFWKLQAVDAVFFCCWNYIQIPYFALFFNRFQNFHWFFNYPMSNSCRFRENDNGNQKSKIQLIRSYRKLYYLILLYFLFYCYTIIFGSAIFLYSYFGFTIGYISIIKYLYLKI